MQNSSSNTIKKGPGRPRKQTIESVVKRGRGRPRKYPALDPSLPKRPRGRPKKSLDGTDARQVVRCGRGRPRKYPALDPSLPKRPRGRPRKYPIEFSVVKRPRGRPRKYPALDPSLPKRPRGRPRKYFVEDDQVVVDKIVEADVYKKEGVVRLGENKLTQMKDNQKEENYLEDKSPFFVLEDDDYIFPVEVKGVDSAKLAVDGATKDKVRVSSGGVKDFGGLKISINKLNTTAAREGNIVNLKGGYKRVDRKMKLDEIIRQEVPVYDIEKEKGYRGGNKKQADLFSRPELVMKAGLKVNLAPEKRSKILEMPENIVLRNLKRSFLMSVFVVGLVLVNLGKLVHFVSKSIWLMVTSPFKLLDFTVDRSLKLVWLFFRALFILFYRFFKIIFTSIRHFARSKGEYFIGDFSGGGLAGLFKPQLQPGWVRAVSTFVVIACVVTLPLSLLPYVRNRVIYEAKSKVLGESSQGLEYLKEASEDLNNFDLVSANLGFIQAQNSFQKAKSEINKLGFVTSQLIKVVPQGKQGYDLLRVGELSAEIAQDLTRIFDEFSKPAELPINYLGKAESQTDQNEDAAQKPQETLVDKIIKLQSSFGSLEVKINEVDSLLKGVDPGVLPDDQAAKLVVVQKWLPQLMAATDSFKQFTDFLVSFLGAQEKKRYLVIFQNNAELRPTGGFMGSFAEVDINKGEIQAMNVPGGGFYDLKGSSKVSVEAPRAFQILESPYFRIFNANYFPDFPESAKKINWFYEQNTEGSTVDGIITLTPDVVIDVLKIIGPLEMPEYGKVITDENFEREVQMAVEVEYDKEENKPKKIIGDMMPLLLERMFSLQGGQFMEVLSAFMKGLENKNILIYSFDPYEADLLEEWGWAGQIRQTSKDYLMVVHTNVKGGKTDKVIKNNIDFKTEVAEDGSIYNTLVLVRQHEGRSDDVFEGQNNVDYVRFYVPQGSELILADNFDILPPSEFKTDILSKERPIKDPDILEIEKNPIIHELSGTRVTQEFGKTCFGNWIMVEPGETKVVTIKYKLPFKFSQVIERKGVVAAWFDNLWGEEEKNATSYSLLLQKQAGDMRTDFVHKVNLPEGWQVVDHLSNSDLDLDGGKVEFVGNLDEDRFFGVVLEK